MPLDRVAATLNPGDFLIAPPVAALDEFRMTNDDGSFVADITPDFLQKLVDHMNAREADTGDLAPLVIGHTVDGQNETDSPPVVGYARSWFIAPLGNTQRLAAYFTPWIFKNEVERVKRFPRRSCEVWASRYEVDPISLLGATTPARDLGLIKLSRDGSYVCMSPGDSTVPDDNKKPDSGSAPPADPKESGANADLKGMIQQLMTMVTQLAQQMAPAGAPPAGPGAGAPPGATGAAGPGGEMSDAELEQLMAELGQPEGGPEEDKSRKGEPEPVKNGYGSPGGPIGNTQMSQAPVKNQRLEDELRDARVRLSRMETKERLRDKELDDKDEALVTDLIALPEDVRNRQIERLSKLSRPATAASSHGLDTAVANASGSPAGPAGSVKRVTTDEEKSRIVKLARSKNVDFSTMARELGYEVNG